MSKKTGFTLAELMAVVAILAILSGLALGSYRKSLDRAQFAEGLRGAHALAAAAEEYYYEQIPNAYPTKMSQLATGLSKATVTDNQISTPNFDYTFITDNGVVLGIKAQVKNRKYGIETYVQNVASVRNLKDKCTFAATPGRDLCESLGYGSCNDTHKYCD